MDPVFAILASPEPVPFVEVINAMIRPTQDTCMAAYRSYIAWLETDNTRRARSMPESQPHLADGHRLAMKLQAELVLLVRNIRAADRLAQDILTVLTDSKDSLLRLGANADDIARDKSELETRRTELAGMLEVFEDNMTDAAAMQIAYGELMFNASVRDAMLDGRRITLQ